ncbi:unnamed protein product [Caenorhabditis brenneri]
MSQPYNNYENYSPELGNGVTINQPPHPGVYSPSAPDMDPYSYINPNFNPYQPEVVVPPPYPSIHIPQPGHNPNYQPYPIVDGNGENNRRGMRTGDKCAWCFVLFFLTIVFLFFARIFVLFIIHGRIR